MAMLRTTIIPIRPSAEDIADDSGQAQTRAAGTSFPRRCVGFDRLKNK